MIKLPGYEITAQISSGVRTVIYRGIREADQKPVVLKVLRSEYPSREDITRLSQEYAIAKHLSRRIARSLDSEGIVISCYAFKPAVRVVTQNPGTGGLIAIYWPRSHPI